MPLLHPNGQPNVASGLLDALHLTTAEGLVAYLAAVISHPAFTQTFSDELTTAGVRVPITSDKELWNEAVDIGKTVIWAQTYGASFASDERPINDIRYPPADARQPKSLSPVSFLPPEMSYRATDEVVTLGDGEFGPVKQAVWDYEVGGRNIVRSWFNYRKADPVFRRSSALDDIHTDGWIADWTTEFIDLLTALDRVSELEGVQADLLRRVLKAPLFSMADLKDMDVKWPAGPQDRSVKYPIDIEADAPTLDLD